MCKFLVIFIGALLLTFSTNIHAENNPVVQLKINGITTYVDGYAVDLLINKEYSVENDSENCSFIWTVNSSDKRTYSVEEIKEKLTKIIEEEIMPKVDTDKMKIQGPYTFDNYNGNFRIKSTAFSLDSGEQVMFMQREKEKADGSYFIDSQRITLGYNYVEWQNLDKLANIKYSDCPKIDKDFHKLFFPEYTYLLLLCFIP